MLASEWKYLNKHKMSLVVLVAIALIPAIYCFIYLSSMWNTYGKMDRLPVAIVNHDRSTTYQGNRIDIGSSLTNKLTKANTLDFHQVSSKRAAEQLRKGKFYMVLTIPKNFSSRATTIIGATPQRMNLHFTFNSGQNFIASKMTTGVATAIKAKVSTQVTRLYSTIILRALGTATEGMKRAAIGSQAMYQGTQKLVNGERHLTGGMHSLNSGISQLSAGSGNLVVANQTITAGFSKVMASTPTANIQRLGSANAKVGNGLIEIQRHVPALQTGADQLANGSIALASGTDKILKKTKIMSASLDQGAKKLQVIHTKAVNAAAIANPVHEVTKDISKVPNNGTGMAPFAIAIGLYVGAIALGTMYEGFLPHRKPKYAITWWASKASVVGAVGFLQTILLFYSLTQANQLVITRSGTFFLVLLLGSFLFLSLIFCLRLLLGGFGTWLVSIVLVLQLAASGGLYPTYLTDSFAQSLNEWLPMTYLINALRSLISTHQGITVDLVVMISLIVGFNFAMILRFQLGLHQSVIEIDSEIV